MAWSRESPTFKEGKRIQELLVIEKICASDIIFPVKEVYRTYPSGAFSAVIGRVSLQIVSVGKHTSSASAQTEIPHPYMQSPRTCGRY